MGKAVAERGDRGEAMQTNQGGLAAVRLAAWGELILPAAKVAACQMNRILGD